jgi:AcrR family transcriptional regulator
VATTARRAPGRTQEDRSAESARRILDAAVELIAEQGYERTTTAEICRRAGFSNSMVHVRYGSKEALLESLMRSYEDAFLQPPEGYTGVDLIERQIQLLQQQVRENPEFLRAFCVLCFETVGPTSGLRVWLTGWLGRYAEYTAQALVAGQREGTVRADIDPAQEGKFLLDVLTGLCMRWVIDPEMDWIGELEAWRRRLRMWLTSQ